MYVPEKVVVSSSPDDKPRKVDVRGWRQTLELLKPTKVDDAHAPAEVIEKDDEVLEEADTPTAKPEAPARKEKEVATKGTSPNLMALTFASHNAFKFCLLLESALRSRIPLTVLGWKAKHRTVGAKLPATYEYLGKMKDDDIVLFVDAFDVVIHDTLEGLKAKYLSMNAPLVFNAEKGCWPWIDSQYGDFKCWELYPPSPSPYRFMNTGGFIGRVANVRKFFATLLKGKEDSIATYDDQDLAAHMFICDDINQRLAKDREAFTKWAAKHGFTVEQVFNMVPGCQPTGALNYGISLDYNCTIFQSVHNANARNESWVPQKMEIHLKWDPARKAYQNRVTGAYPAVFHFNGGGKEHVDTLHKQMETTWDDNDEAWREAEKDGRIIQFEGFPELTYEDVCAEWRDGVPIGTKVEPIGETAEEIAARKAKEAPEQEEAEEEDAAPVVKRSKTKARPGEQLRRKVKLT